MSEDKRSGLATECLAELRALADADGKAPRAALEDLLDRWNRRITYRGLNALEVEALTEPSEDDWPAVWEWYQRGVEGPFSTLTKRRTLWVVAILGALLAVLGGGYRWAATIPFAVVIQGFGRREGHREGYSAGYEQGHYDGVCRALGIPREERESVYRLADEMRVHEAIWRKGTD